MIARYEKLEPSEQWFQDGQDTLELAAAFGYEDIDMTETKKILAQAKQQGIKCTYTHIVVRAAALVFARHPEFNRLLLKRKMVYPAQVDIGVAVHTDYSSVSAPFEIVINDAVQKNLVQIAEDIITKAAQARDTGDQKRHEKLNRLSRIFFAAWMRRAMYRKMRTKMAVVRRMIGTFHVSSLPNVKQAASLRFPTTANLLIARVEEQPVVRDGQVVVRPICSMGLMVDRHVWDGIRIGIFLSELKKILEGGELYEELPTATASFLAEELSAR